MAVTFATGWEGQAGYVDVGFAPPTVGTAAYSTDQKRTGNASIRCNPASGASGYVPTGPTTEQYTHFGLYVASLPSLDRRIFGSTTVGTLNVRLTSAGALAIYVYTTLIGTSFVAFSTPGWHWVGIRQVTGTNVVLLQIDGVVAVSGTLIISAWDNTFGFGGTEASAVDVYFDDIVVDSAGFLAPSKVDIALPISDNTRTGMTAGAGGTSNLWDAVNNTPPAGAATDTNISNISSPASTTTNYLANLETYETLGVSAGDTVLAVRSITRSGEHINTGTKTATVGAVTNPTIAGTAIATVGTGAHGAETGYWLTTFGTMTTNPTVTLYTSPTIAIVRASEARVACWDFMGLLVVWTPAYVPRSGVTMFQDPGMM